MAERKPVPDASICANWGGRYPEGHRIPAANNPNKTIFVGNMQICNAHVVGEYCYICPFTAAGALTCPDYQKKEAEGV